MSHVLIVGNNSYIGTSFQKYLQKEEQGSWTAKKLSVRNDDWHQMDFSEFDVILYCAAIVHQKESKHTERDYEKVNCDLPVTLAQKAKREGVSQFVFLSTMAVYGMEGKIGKTICIGKKTMPNPKTNYAKSKYKAEGLLLAEKTKSFTVTILRPPMVYGEDCPGNYTRLKKIVLKYKVFPDLRNERSMIFVDNLCQMIKEVIDEKKEGILHPQDRKYTCTLEMVKDIAQEAGSPLFIFKLLSVLVYLSSPFVPTVHKVWGGLVYDSEIDSI